MIRHCIFAGLIAFATLAGAQETGLAETTDLDAHQTAVVVRLVEGLASPSFADRERAAGELMAMGIDAVPVLTAILRDATDPEVQLRGSEIVRQLTDGDMQARVDDFLAGRTNDFDGWNMFRGIFGDNSELRQMFIELTQSHPEVVKAIDGTTRDRVVALEKVMVAMQQKMFVQRKFPTATDTFALAYATVDNAVPLTVAFESVFLSMLQKEGASKLRANPLLSPPFKGLIARILPRTSLASRIEMLLTGMTWDLPATLPLAIQTLGETKQTETIAVSLQVIARFGEKEHALLLTDLLDDPRDATEGAFIEGEPIRTTIGDLVMVTIGILYDADLKELGMGDAQPHPTYGFIIGDVGFPTNDSGPRAATRKKIDRLLKGEPAS